MKKLVVALVAITTMIFATFVWIETREVVIDPSVPAEADGGSELTTGAPTTRASEPPERSPALDGSPEASPEPEPSRPVWSRPVESAAEDARPERGSASRSSEQPARRPAQTVSPVAPPKSSSPQAERRPAPSERPVAAETTLSRAPSPDPVDPPDPPEELADEHDPSSDTNPPQLLRLNFASPSVRGGETTQLNIEAVDDISGIASLVGRVQSASGSATVTFSARASGAEDERWFTSQLGFPQKAETGRWFVSFLRIADRANNAQNFRWSTPGDPGTASIQVTSEDSDGDPPVISDVFVRDVAVEPGSEVTIEVIVRDEISGVANVTGAVVSPSRAAHLPLFGGEGDADRWVARVSLPTEAECGEWRIARLQASDRAGNRALLPASDPLLDGKTFYVSFGGECDSSAPTLESITVTPSVVSNEEDSIVRVSAFVDDIGSGVAYVSGIFQAEDVEGSRNPPRINFTLRKSESSERMWVGDVPVPKFSARGRWSLLNVRVADEARNQRIYSIRSDPELASGWFVVE